MFSVEKSGGILIPYQAIETGTIEPLGAKIEEGGVNFALFSEHATKVILVLLDSQSKKIRAEIPLDEKKNKTGFIWHIFLRGLSLPICYAYKVDGPHKAIHGFYPDSLLLDPYAKDLTTPKKWGSVRKQGGKYQPYALLTQPLSFDWQGDTFPRHRLKDLVIYEMHVRSFTEHPSSKVTHRGTFLGIVEKIPYLKELGINAVELMPIQEFDECSYEKVNPKTGEQLYNYWGYSSLNFFAPMGRYTSSKELGGAAFEFKTLVRELHKQKIEVILDIVFNHTGECKTEGKVISFLGIDRSSYYFLLPNGKDQNYTGCGNTMNLSHPMMRKFIRACLHYWVLEMHVDGFRFDLASIMNRDTQGHLVGSSPLIEELSVDPILAETKLIAEPWDAAGGYQLGGFYPQKNRWAEWNGQYRDCVRKFIKGEPHTKNHFASRIAGSQDIFPHRSPEATINFVTAHDGFTLADLVSYNKKHNVQNGEQSRDGSSYNISWNCGVEGESDDPHVLYLRNKQRKNFMLSLMISKGAAMLLMGDEYGHTREGNNNTWCHDNELNYFLWKEVEKENPFYLFTKKLIHFRHTHPLLHTDRFYEGKDIEWHGKEIGEPEWEKEAPFIAFTLFDHEKGHHLYIAFNATHEEVKALLPSPGEDKRWHQLINTSLPEPEDFVDLGKEKPFESDHFLVPEYSALVLKAF